MKFLKFNSAARCLDNNRVLPDTDLLEFVCNENERDLRHLNVK
jgi:hypothetical protein